MIYINIYVHIYIYIHIYIYKYMYIYVCNLLQSLSLEQTNASDASLRALVDYSHK